MYCCFAVLLWTTLASPPSQESPAALAGNEKEVARVIDNWHDAAAKADENRYFAHFTANAIFLGTDATERWTRDEFRKWCKPYFSRGKAWSFQSVKRHIYFSDDKKTAWFDEELATPNLGPARGSGVLLLESTGWKIAHYNLATPIPNEIFPEVKKLLDKGAKLKK